MLDDHQANLWITHLQGAARFGASWLACAAAAKISATACGGNLDLLKGQV